MSYIFQSNGCDSFYLLPLMTKREFKGDDEDNKQSKISPSVVTDMPTTCPETSAKMKIGE